VTPICERFATAIAAGDRDALVALLAPDVRLRAVTPSRLWEADSAAAAADVILGTWFTPDRNIEVDRIDSDTVGGCERVGYRFRATLPEGPRIVEQQAYLDVDGDAITALRIACTGFRPG
jgi:hypothetical protein